MRPEPFAQPKAPPWGRLANRLLRMTSAPLYVAFASLRTAWAERKSAL